MQIGGKAIDQIHYLSDLIAVEQEPIRRLATAEAIYRHVTGILQKQLHSAAYEARVKYAVRDIEAMTGIDASRVSYYTRKHCERESLPMPKHRVRVSVDSYIDLSGE